MGCTYENADGNSLSASAQPTTMPQPFFVQICPPSATKTATTYECSNWFGRHNKGQEYHTPFLFLSPLAYLVDASLPTSISLCSEGETIGGDRSADDFGFHTEDHYRKQHIFPVGFSRSGESSSYSEIAWPRAPFVCHSSKSWVTKSWVT